MSPRKRLLMEVPLMSPLSLNVCSLVYTLVVACTNPINGHQSPLVALTVTLSIAICSMTFLLTVLVTTASWFTLTSWKASSQQDENWQSLKLSLVATIVFLNITYCKSPGLFGKNLMWLSEIISSLSPFVIS
jgi:hypothetical protein